MTRSDLPADVPHIRLDRAPNNLPVQLNSFIGRADEMSKVLEMLGNTRCLTLTGPGGSGKTRMATQVAARSLDRFPDGVWFIELARIHDPNLVAAAFSEPLGIMESPNQSFDEGLLAGLGGRKVLLVIDNCEHLVEPVALLVDEILRRCENVTVLATSREALAVEGEVAWPLPTLHVPEEGDEEEQIFRSDSVLLFMDRVKAVRPDKEFTVDESPYIAEICRRLDGIPLAIELAAARTKLLSPREIAEGLNDRFALLGSPARGGVSRNQTLEASVAWSHDLLSEEESSLFRRLATFRGDFSLESAAAVCGDERAIYVLLEHLGGLVDKSLVQVESEGGFTRYRMLETIREFARARLVESGEADSIDDKHLEHFASMADSAVPGLESGSSAEWLDRIEADHDNFRAALDRALRSGQIDSAYRVVAALAHFWIIRGHFTEGLERTRAVFKESGGDPTLRARALVSACGLWFYLFDLGTGMAAAQEALAITAANGDEQARGRALNWLGWGATMLDPATARPHFEEAVAIGRELGDVWGLSYALNGLGFVSSVRGEPEVGHPILDEARRLADVTGDSLVYRQSLIWDGWMYVEQSEYERAEESLTLAISISENMRDPLSTNIAELWLGVLDIHRGRYETAEARLEKGAQRARDTGNPMMEANFFGWMGYLGLASGDYATGVGHSDTAIQFFSGIGANWFTATYQAIRSRMELATGSVEEARQGFQRALELGELAEQPWSQARAFLGLARIDVLEGRPGEAHGKALEGIERLRSSGRGYVTGQIEGLEVLASAVFHRSSPEQSARLLGAADRLRADLGYVAFAPDAADMDELRAHLDEALGDRLLDELRAGSQMSLDEAISYASRNRGSRKRPATGWESLTPMEQEVAKLVAECLTNPQIGERLFISRRTVQGHVSRIFAKLGLSNRAELIARYQDLSG